MDGDPWAYVRVSIEQHSGEAKESVWVALIPVYRSDDLGERVESTVRSWTASQFRQAIEESWAKRKPSVEAWAKP